MKNRKSGLTLVEVIVAMAITLFLAVTISKYQTNMFDTSEYLQSSLRAEDDAKSVLRSLITEIRSMNYSSAGSYMIEAAEPGSLIFYDDMNGDGNTERLRYFIDGTTLKRGIVYPTGSPLSYGLSSERVSVVVSNVVAGASVFSYYDDSYNGTGASLSVPIDIPVVRLIGVNIPIRLDRGSGSTTYNVGSQVSIRNLKDNL